MPTFCSCTLHPYDTLQSKSYDPEELEGKSGLTNSISKTAHTNCYYLDNQTQLAIQITNFSNTTDTLHSGHRSNLYNDNQSVIQEDSQPTLFKRKSGSVHNCPDSWKAEHHLHIHWRQYSPILFPLALLLVL